VKGSITSDTIAGGHVAMSIRELGATRTRIAGYASRMKTNL
jgi:hypothetical protein